MDDHKCDGSNSDLIWVISADAADFGVECESKEGEMIAIKGACVPLADTRTRAYPTYFVVHPHLHLHLHPPPHAHSRPWPYPYPWRFC